MKEFSQYIIEKTGLNLGEKKLSSLSKIYTTADFMGNNIFKVAKHFVNPETSFFRNMEVSELLRNLIDQKNSRVWFAGCSTGQEVYSTYLMSKKNLNLKLIGTDLNIDAIYHAKEGKYFLYRSKEIEKINVYRKDINLNIYPSENLNSTYVEFKKSLGKIVLFDIHNLVVGPYSLEFDIVICRNVLLHMTENGKAKVLKSLAASVKTGGFLILGDTDPKMTGAEWKRINKGNIVLWQKT
ncbi:MAG: CheR family methyltransferase [Paracoccaceae bacterium]